MLGILRLEKNTLEEALEIETEAMMKIKILKSAIESRFNLMIDEMSVS